ncbi:12856_t:CDS:2, partial [Rhizophagus irregularis]
YQFEYNQNFIENDQINLLRTWPDDDQIHRIFDQSRQIACNIAEYLGMLTLDIVPINSFWPYVLITSNDMEISGSNDENMQDKETENTISTDFDDMIFVTKNRIDFQEMIYRREKHNAYTSRNIERTIKTNNTRIINSTSINPNQANHIVSFFTKNENAEMRQSIANFYEKEQSNKRQKILSKFANINQDNPLNEQDYVIAYYGIQLCIGQVISSFYEAYRYHFYNQEPITDIENISYLTLKVFTPIRNIFSAEIEGGHILITHQCPKNVLYHLDMQDIQIFDNTLQLLDKAKACYNFFKKEEIIYLK